MKNFRGEINYMPEELGGMLWVNEGDPPSMRSVIALFKAITPQVEHIGVMNQGQPVAGYSLSEDGLWLDVMSSLVSAVNQHALQNEEIEGNA
jgi:hypothetical protein